jgi:enamine deaminase RidA (YjgF/YER057c/UK114 family)
VSRQPPAPTRPRGPEILARVLPTASEGASVQRSFVNPWTWQEQFGFVHGNLVTGASRTLLLAGQTAVDEEGRPTHVGDMVGQVEASLDAIERVLSEAGMTLADVVRLNIYTTDVDAFFGAHPMLVARLAEAGCTPASTLLGGARLAFPEFLVELEATAMA